MGDSQKWIGLIEPRIGARQAVLVAVMVGVPGDSEPMEITIDEMSISGFTAAAPRKIDQGVMLCVAMPMHPRQYATVVRSDDRRVTCAFTPNISAGDLEIMAHIWSATIPGRSA